MHYNQGPWNHACEIDIDSLVYEPKSNFYPKQQFSHLFDEYEINWGDGSQYEFRQQIAEGGFSKVYYAWDEIEQRTVVIKKQNPLQQELVDREIFILDRLKGENDIVELEDYYQLEDESTCFVYRYLSGTTEKELNSELSDLEVRYYMYRLLKALSVTHRHGIMHRDVKTLNVIINKKHHRLELIDWGLAELYHKESSNSLSVMTKYYQPPEILLKNKCYDYTLDSWGAGCVLQKMLFKERIFDGSDDQSVLESILPFYGYDKMEEYINKFNLDTEMLSLIDRDQIESDSFENWIEGKNEDSVSEDGLDLMKQLLEFDHSKRISPEQALQHKFFDQVRHKSRSEVFG